MRGVRPSVHLPPLLWDVENHGYHHVWRRDTTCLPRFAGTVDLNWWCRTRIASEPQSVLLSTDVLQSETHSLRAQDYYLRALFPSRASMVQCNLRGRFKQGPTLSTPDGLVPLTSSTGPVRSCACPEVNVTVPEQSISVVALIDVTARITRWWSSLATAWVGKRRGCGDAAVAN